MLVEVGFEMVDRTLALHYMTLSKYQSQTLNKKFKSSLDAVSAFHVLMVNMLANNWRGFTDV